MPEYPVNWFYISTATKEQRGNRCELCGFKKGDYDNNCLTVHHQDHNPFNNDPSNLRVLCARCHLRIEGSYRVANHKRKELVRLFTSGQEILPGFEIGFQFKKAGLQSP
jgi:hypothetical protein